MSGLSTIRQKAYNPGDQTAPNSHGDEFVDKKVMPNAIESIRVIQKEQTNMSIRRV